MIALVDPVAQRRETRRDGFVDGFGSGSDWYMDVSIVINRPVFRQFYVLERFLLGAESFAIADRLLRFFGRLVHTLLIPALLEGRLLHRVMVVMVRVVIGSSLLLMAFEQIDLRFYSYFIFS